ncbi:beta/alpha barrel domain-containing protein [Streptomyces resistomycificus]|uniref:hypothetical protein n=1 Tax=Streptomyces resistomycificus TaxID=67356 RepID=UPI001CED3405|nr:hypothetical protein [Streptomyces resistomycificus]
MLPGRLDTDRGVPLSLIHILPDIPLVAVGGVGIEEARDYLDAGACAVGIGSPLLRGADQDPTPQALDALTTRARTLLEAVGITARAGEASA